MPMPTAAGWRRFHGIATLIWIGLVPPTMLFWRDSIAWLAAMSIWANIASHAAAYQGARAEENGG